MDDCREPSDDLDAQRLGALRLAARAAYTLERTPVTLRELWQRDAFRCLSYRQIYEWYAEEGWSEERRLNVAAWRREGGGSDRRGLEEGRREREADGLRRLLSEAAWLRQQPTVRPKSWESVAQVHIKTIELFRQWDREDREARERAEELAMSRQGEGDHFMGDISEEETRRMAHFLLERRLDQSRQNGDEGRQEEVGDTTGQARDAGVG